MARASRGASRSWDASQCVPAPAPELVDAGDGLLQCNPYDTGCDAGVDCAVRFYRSGVFEDVVSITAGDLLNFGATYQTDGVDDWTCTIVIPPGGYYCAGETAPSNDVNFG